MVNQKKIGAFVAKLKEYVSGNELEKACDLLIDSSEERLGRTLKRRIMDYRRDDSNGVIDHDTFKKEKNKIADSLLSTAEQIESGIIRLTHIPKDILDDHEGKVGITFDNESATQALNRLERIEVWDGRKVTSDATKLLFSKETEIQYTRDDTIIYQENGVDGKLDHSELVSVIKINDALNIAYEEMGVISVRSYLKKLSPKPITVTVQALALSDVTIAGREMLLDLIAKTKYSDKPHDKIWVEENPPEEALEVGEVLLVMNRRVGGWSGSLEDPRIELLLGGGTMPTIWNSEEMQFKQMTPTEVIIKEFEEEVKFSLSEDDIEIVGGFYNEVSNQLVILCVVFIKCADIPDIQKGALNNVEEKVDGIYLGRLENVIQNYLKDPTNFAGGKKAMPTNFPSQPDLVARLKDKINEKFQVKVILEKEAKPKTKQSTIKKLSNLLEDHEILSTSFSKVKKNGLDILNVVGFGIDWIKYVDTIDHYAYLILKSELHEWEAEDIYCMCCAIYLHKVGLIGYLNELPVDTYDNHSLRGKNLIKENGKKMGIIPEAIEDIAWIIYGHKNTADGKRSIDDQELLTKLKMGALSRIKLSFYLKLLSSLSILEITVPKIYHGSFFTQSDKQNALHNEVLSSQIFSGIKIIDNIENKKVLLRIGAFDQGQLLSSLKIIMNTQNRLAAEIRRCRSFLSHSSFFFQGEVIDVHEISFSEHIRKYVYTAQFLEELRQAIFTAVKALVDAKYPYQEDNLQGWGPYLVVKHEEEDFEDFRSPRIVNTSEVLMALSKYKVYETDIEFYGQAKTVIQQVIQSLDSGRISRVNASRKLKITKAIKELKNEIDEKKKLENGDRIYVLEKRLKIWETRHDAEQQYDPFTSLTNEIPTIRVNSIPIFAFSHLLDSRADNFLDQKTYEHIKRQMKNCIHWVCYTDATPFDEGDMLIDKHIFQFIISMKALVRSEKYWDEIGVEDHLKSKLYKKIIEFAEALIDLPKAKWPSTPYLAMSLEMLVFYLQKSNEVHLFNKQIQIKSLISEIVDSLCEEISLASFKKWEDTKDFIYDSTGGILEDYTQNIREWTHITGAWVVEGLAQCYLGNQLNGNQENRFLEMIPILLIEQGEDGFFDSFTEQHPSVKTTKFIYKTALWAHSFNLVYEILSSRIH